MSDAGSERRERHWEATRLQQPGGVLAAHDSSSESESGDDAAAAASREDLLLRCVQEGRSKELAALLRLGGVDVDATYRRPPRPDTEDCDGDGEEAPFTLLFAAVERGDVDCMRVLLDHGADPNILCCPMIMFSGGFAAYNDPIDDDYRWYPEDRFSALMVALYKGPVESVELLLDAGADTLNSGQSGGERACVFNGSVDRAPHPPKLEMTMCLLRKGVDPVPHILRRKQDHTAPVLRRAINEQHVALTRELLSRGLDSSYVMRDCELGYRGPQGEEVIEVLAEYGVRDEEHKYLLEQTPEVAVLLFEKGIMPFVLSTRLSRYMNHIAGFSKDAIPALGYLLDRGADVDTVVDPESCHTKWSEYDWPLWSAVRFQEDAEVAKYLLKRGADPCKIKRCPPLNDGEEGLNFTLLHAVVEGPKISAVHAERCVVLIRLLASLNVDPNHPDCRLNPIHILAMHTVRYLQHFLRDVYPPVVMVLKTLVEIGVDLNAREPSHGSTALHVMAGARHYLSAMLPPRVWQDRLAERFKLGLHFCAILIENGADPALEDNYGLRPVDYLPPTAKAWIALLDPDAYKLVGPRMALMKKIVINAAC